jgi:hypothetical protein
MADQEGADSAARRLSGGGSRAPRASRDHEGRVCAWNTTDILIGPGAGDRALPQGACATPAISNLAARKLDRGLSGTARKMGWTYTRYADDLTFSCGREHAGEIPLLLEV